MVVNKKCFVLHAIELCLEIFMQKKIKEWTIVVIMFKCMKFQRFISTVHYLQMSILYH